MPKARPLCEHDENNRGKYPFLFRVKYGVKYRYTKVNFHPLLRAWTTNEIRR